MMAYLSASFLEELYLSVVLVDKDTSREVHRAQKSFYRILPPEELTNSSKSLEE
jgi:hypothetical protein